MKNSILFLIALLFVGCNASKQELEFEKPEILIPKKNPEPRKNKGSLYSTVNQRINLILLEISRCHDC